MPESLRDILAREPWEAVEGFLRRWHGWTPPRNQLPGADGLPPALRRVYATLGSAPALFTLNRLLTPAEVGRDGDHVVFFVEEQSVYLWAVAGADLAQTDPPVWMRENEPRAAWVAAAPSIGVFMLQMLLMSAAMDAPHSAYGDLTASAVTQGLADLDPLELAPWEWPASPAKWYAGDSVVAFTCPNGDLVSVWVGALDPAALPSGADWDYVSSRDG